MDCREFEDRLEALLDGALDERERRRCDRHLEGCGRCRELVAPFAIVPELGPAAAAPELLGAVLARTSGSPCGRAESLLAAWQDGELAAADGQLLAAHLDGCGDCRALAAVMSRLTAELPRLAELGPDPGFAAAVLAATLPLPVRVRRSWTAVWPQWVRRPRFASEAAFVATLALVLIFAMPGSPLAAMPDRALELARTPPRPRLEQGLEAIEERLAAGLGEPLRRRWARGRATLVAWTQAAGARSRTWTAAMASAAGTSRETVASLWERADREAPSEQPDPDSEPETPSQEQR